MIYEVVVIEHPKKKDAENGDVEKIVVDFTRIVAKSDKAAVNQVIIKNAAALAESDPDRLEILVRPFK